MICHHAFNLPDLPVRWKPHFAAWPTDDRTVLRGGHGILPRRSHAKVGWMFSLIQASFLLVRSREAMPAFNFNGISRAIVGGSSSISCFLIETYKMDENSSRFPQGPRSRSKSCKGFLLMEMIILVFPQILPKHNSLRKQAEKTQLQAT
jgi:hypothetical protein